MSPKWLPLTAALAAGVIAVTALPSVTAASAAPAWPPACPASNACHTVIVANQNTAIPASGNTLYVTLVEITSRHNSSLNSWLNRLRDGDTVDLVSSRSLTLRGTTVREHRSSHHFHQIRRALSDNHFWSPSYCAVSYGAAPQEIIMRYIQNQ